MINIWGRGNTETGCPRPTVPTASRQKTRDSLVIATVDLRAVDPYLETAEAVLHGVAPGLEGLNLAAKVLGKDTGKDSGLKGTGRLSIGREIDTLKTVSYLQGQRVVIFQFDPAKAVVGPELPDILYQPFRFSGSDTGIEGVSGRETGKVEDRVDGDPP
jgi:hypothetical protein